MRRVAAVSMMIGAGLLVSTTGCGFMDTPGSRKTEERTVENVHAVELATSGSLTVKRGDTTSLTVTAGENRLSHLTSEVRNGVLVLGTEESWRGNNGRITYELVVSELDQVTLSGSGDVDGAEVTGDDLRVDVAGSGSVDLSGVSADDVEVTVSGSGDVTLGGTSKAAAFTVDGSGTVDAENLALEEADVVISGSGDVDLAVSTRLNASLAGSGTVTYTGNPEVISDIEGVGSVSQS